VKSVVSFVFRFTALAVFLDNSGFASKIPVDG